jgi:hypothetical protein
MRIDAHDPQGKFVRVHYWPIKGCPRHPFDQATGFDSDEKWVEFIPYLPNPSDKTKFRIMTANGHIQKCRVYIDYDVVDIKTGNTILEVRQ